jgi:hypothetical protein
MRRLWTLGFMLLLGGGLVFAQRRPHLVDPGNRKEPPGTLVIHVRMEAVMVSDNDGSNPGGIASVEQLKQWVHQANETYRTSNARLMLDFDPDTDIAHLKDSCLNRLNHNQNGRAAAAAAQYPGNHNSTDSSTPNGYTKTGINPMAGTRPGRAVRSKVGHCRGFTRNVITDRTGGSFSGPFCASARRLLEVPRSPESVKEGVNSHDRDICTALGWNSGTTADEPRG